MGNSLNLADFFRKINLQLLTVYALTYKDKNVWAFFVLFSPFSHTKAVF